MARRARDPEARIQALEKHLGENPASPAFFPLASLVWEKGEANRAEELLRKGLEAHPAYAAPRVLLGEILIAKDQAKEAAALLEQAVQSAPWNLAGQRLLAECHRRAGDEAAARRALRLIGMFDPSDELARGALEDAPPAAAAPPKAGSPPPGAVPTPSLAELYVSQGHLKQAAGIYRQLLKEEPGNREWAQKLALLEQKMAGAAEEAPPAAGPKAGPAEDMELEALLGQAEAAEAEAGAAPAEAAPERAAPPANDLDLESLLADVEEVGAPAESAAPQEVAGEDFLEAAEAEPEGGAPGEAAAELDDLDLEAFLSEEAGAPQPAAPGGGAEGESPPATLMDEEEMEALLELEEEAGAGAAAEEEVDLLSEAELAEAPPAEPPEGEAGSPPAELDLEEADLGAFEEIGEEGASRPALPEEALEEAVPAEELQELPPSEGEVAPVLKELIRLYVSEGNLEQALDLCRKASGLGEGGLAALIGDLEQELAGSAPGRLQGRPGDAKDGAAQPLAVSPAEVIRRLEGWLETLRRRKMRAAAGSRGGAGG